tara:strand:- start:2693 stop:4309 length:1617 start_codon:yes stop_codon:yes gene_type:complete
MKKFNELIEATGKPAVITFGRFNPPTIGHEKVIDVLAKHHSKHSGSKMYVYPSHSQDPKKNPLPHTKKVAYMRAMFPKYKRNIVAGKERNIFEVANSLYKKGHDSVVMVVGSDRVQEFDKLLNTYNNVKGKHGFYNFNSISIVSAGERDPDSEGVSGMSASKMRAAAADGDKKSFMTGLPTTFKDGEKLYRDIRSQMGIREERNMGDMTDYETVRDMYLTGKIWNAGDIIEAKGVTGEVVRKGTNYLSFVDEEGKVHKAWLHEITLNERDYKKEYANYQGKPEQIARRSSRNKARRIMGDKAKVGMDVGHKDNDPMNNDPKNLRNEDPSKNRREPRLRDKELEEDWGDTIPWLKKLKNKIFDKTHKKSLDNLSFAYAKKAAKEYEKDKRMNPIHIVHDLARMYTNVSDRVLRDHINGLVKKGLIPQELKAEFEPLDEKGKRPKLRDFDRFRDSIGKKKKPIFQKQPKEKGRKYGKKKRVVSPFKEFVDQLQVNEKLSKDATAGDYIDDFEKSDAPQFKGKSKDKRKKMAIAAFYANKK